MAETTDNQVNSLGDDHLVLPHHSMDISLDEKTDKKASSSETVGVIEECLDPERPVFDSEKTDTVLVNGEPVITNGKDISRYIVDLRDDGDPSLTFRSILLGTVFAGLGAALYQVTYTCSATKSSDVI